MKYKDNTIDKKETEVVIALEATPEIKETEELENKENDNSNSKVIINAINDSCDIIKTQIELIDKLQELLKTINKI